MATLKLGPIVADARGRVGGSIIQRSQAGVTLRTLHKPTNPSSPLQTLQRSILADLQTRWQKLNDAQRTAWSAWAEFNNNLTPGFAHTGLTGQQTYIMVNFARTRAGRPIISDPVFTPLTEQAGQPILTNAFGQLRITWPAPGSLDTSDLFMFLSIPLTASRYTRPPKLVLMRPYVKLDANTANITTAYQAAYGIVPASGTKLWARWYFQQITNGALSVELQQPLIVQ